MFSLTAKPLPIDLDLKNHYAQQERINIPDGSMPISMDLGKKGQSQGGI